MLALKTKFFAQKTNILSQYSPNYRCTLALPCQKLLNVLFTKLIEGTFEKLIKRSNICAESSVLVMNAASTNIPSASRKNIQQN